MSAGWVANGVASDGKSFEINYHFDVNGDTVTLIAHVPYGGEIASLTPLFRCADWPERELMFDDGSREATEGFAQPAA